MNLTQLARADELYVEIVENRERMVNVAKQMRINVKKSRVISIMHWAARATQILDKKLRN